MARGQVAVAIELLVSERRELDELAWRGRTAQGLARQARIVLLAAEGLENKAIVAELGAALSADLRDELERLALPFGEEAAPSVDELRIAQAQLVGWMEGLIQGIQATLFAQQMAAQQQLAGMRHPELAPGDPVDGPETRHGTYL